MLEFAQWLQFTGLFTYLRSSAYTYPIILSLHMCGIAMFGGMIMLGDFRLLGISMRNRSISDLIDQLRIPKRYGALLMITCGVLLAGSKAEEYYYNAFFRVKVILLLCVFLHGWVFRKSVYQDYEGIGRRAADSRGGEGGGCNVTSFMDRVGNLWARYRVH